MAFTSGVRQLTCAMIGKERRLTIQRHIEGMTLTRLASRAFRRVATAP